MEPLAAGHVSVEPTPNGRAIRLLRISHPIAWAAGALQLPEQSTPAASPHFTFLSNWSPNWYMAACALKREAIENAVSQIMVGDEALAMRSRAKELGKMARRVVEEGGSSFKDLSALISELRSLSS